MVRKVDTSYVITSLDNFFQTFPESEEWVKKNLNIDHLKWDAFENLKHIVLGYLSQHQGEYVIMENKQYDQIMIQQIEPMGYILSGSISGPGVELQYGTVREVKDHYLSLARQRYNADLVSYENAKQYVEENWDSDYGLILF